MKKPSTRTFAGAAAIVLVGGTAASMYTYRYSAHKSSVRPIPHLKAEAAQFGLDQTLEQIMPQPSAATLNDNASPIFVEAGKLYDTESKNARLQTPAKSKDGRLLPLTHAGALTDSQVVALAQELRPATERVVAASKMKWCLAPHDLSVSAMAVTLPELTGTRSAEKLLASDAQAAGITNDIGRARNDLMALSRMTMQIVQQRALVDFYVASSAQSTATLTSLDLLARHPHEIAWAKLVLDVNQSLKEIPYAWFEPGRWRIALDAAHMLIDHPGMADSVLTFDHEPYSRGTSLADWLTSYNSSFASAYLDVTLYETKSTNLQFVSLDEWEKQSSLVRSAWPQTNAYSRAIQAIIPPPIRLLRWQRLQRSMAIIAANAVISHIQTGKWPTTPSATIPGQLPGQVSAATAESSQIEGSPSAAQPRLMVSTIDTFTGRPIGILQTADGVTIEGRTTPGGTVTIDPAAASNPKDADIVLIHLTSDKISTTHFRSL